MKLLRLALFVVFLGFWAVCFYEAYRAYAGPPAPKPTPGITANEARTLGEIPSRALSGFRQLQEHKGVLDETALARAVASRAGMTFEPDLELLTLADNPELFPTAGDRADFLQAHGTTLQLLRDSTPGDVSAQKYVKDLKQCLRDPEKATRVKFDPIALMMETGNVSLSPEQWEFYQKNHEWLGTVLLQIEANQEAKPPKTQETVIVEVIETCRKHPKQSQVAGESFGADGIALLLAFPEAISQLVAAGIPIHEVLEVIFANAEDIRTEPNAILTLCDMYGNKDVWDAAKRLPRVLWLYSHDRKQCIAIVKQFPEDNIPGMLADIYADALKPAAEALIRVPELALHVLGRAAVNEVALPKFKEALNQHGWRVVPYVAQHGLSDGSAQVSQEWLNKYFDAEGQPREKEWWTTVPIVGAPADLVRQLKNGTVEADEVGWAALDVGDGVLLIASMGTSSGVIAAKQAAKAGIKNRTRKGLTLSVVRAASRSGSLLKRAAGKFVLPTLAFRVGKFVIGRFARLMESPIKALNAGWIKVTTKQGKWVARGLLAVGLGITLQYRTIPGLEMAFKKALERIQKTAENLVEYVQGLIDAIEAPLKKLADATGVSFVAIKWAVSGIVSIGIAYWVCPRRRRGARHV